MTSALAFAGNPISRMFSLKQSFAVLMGALLGLAGVGAASVTEAGRPPRPAHRRFSPACRIAFASISSVLAALWKQRARNSASARLAHAWLLVCGVFMPSLSVFFAPKGYSTGFKNHVAA